MRVAIVGSGVSGLSSLWLLNEHSDHEVNIYEKEDYPGGHTHTVEFKREGKPSCQVDTGFIVLNPVTYPNFLRFLRKQNVPLNETEMTFSVSRDRGKFEWAGDGPLALFCQFGNLFNPRLYRMIFDIIRFNLFAIDLLQLEGRAAKQLSIGEYLDNEGYSDVFKEDYLLPMTGAIWSTPADKAALDFPALTLVRFFHNHHLLQITGKPKWLTVKGGSKLYVDSILSKLPKENLHLNTEIVSVASRDDGVELTEKSGAKHIYDHVIMATHSDTTLRLLNAGGKVTPQEDKALSVWSWSKNEAVLHWDERFRPIRSRAYSGKSSLSPPWNYLTSTSKPAKDPKTTSSSVDTVALTYGMNILQHLPEAKYGPILVTLNPPFPVDPSKTIGRWTYEHPTMTDQSVSAQSLLPSIQNRRRIAFAGAWTKYGFHEDGFSSGMRLVCAPPFNVRPPFPIKPPHRAVESGRALVVARVVVGVMQLLLELSEPVWPLVGGVAGWAVGLMVGLFAILGLEGWREEAVRVQGCWKVNRKVEESRKTR